MILIQKIKKIKVQTWLKEVIIDILFFAIVSTILVSYLYIYFKKQPEKAHILRKAEHVPAETEEKSLATDSFVASSRGKYYYKVGSEKANSLSEKNKVYFKTKEEAEKLGFKPYFND